MTIICPLLLAITAVFVIGLIAQVVVLCKKVSYWEENARRYWDDPDLDLYP